jgi:hypothetical protein
LGAVDESLHLCGDVGVLGVQSDLGTERCRKPELVVIHIDGGDVHAHRLRVLNGHMAEAADPRDHDPFARSELRFKRYDFSKFKQFSEFILKPEKDL